MSGQSTEPSCRESVRPVAARVSGQSPQTPSGVQHPDFRLKIPLQRETLRQRPPRGPSTDFRPSETPSARKNRVKGTGLFSPSFPSFSFHFSFPFRFYTPCACTKAMSWGHVISGRSSTATDPWAPLLFVLSFHFDSASLAPNNTWAGSHRLLPDLSQANHRRRTDGKLKLPDFGARNRQSSDWSPTPSCQVRNTGESREWTLLPPRARPACLLACLLSLFLSANRTVCERLPSASPENRLDVSVENLEGHTLRKKKRPIPFSRCRKGGDRTENPARSRPHRGGRVRVLLERTNLPVAGLSLNRSQ